MAIFFELRIFIVFFLARGDVFLIVMKWSKGVPVLL